MRIRSLSLALLAISFALPAVAASTQFATWSRSDASPNVAISPDGLTAFVSSSAGAWAGVRANIATHDGLWYWETTYFYSGSSEIQTGLAFTNWSLSQAPGEFGSLARASGVDSAGAIWSGGQLLGGVGSVANGVVVRHLFDATAGDYYVANGRGLWVAAVPFSGFFERRPQFPIASMAVTSGIAAVTANFGAMPFAYPVPAGAHPGLFDVPIFADGFDGSP